MAFQEQIDKLVTKLTDLTQKGRVEWTESGGTQAFLAPVGNHRVAIRMFGSGPEAEYALNVYDETGTLIEEAWGTEEPLPTGQYTVVVRTPGPGQPSPQERLRSLYQVARRSALAVDKSLSDILASLEQIR